MSDEEYIYDNCYDKENEIMELEIMITKMESDIKYLWTSVIVPYTADITRCQILMNYDATYIEFYDYMINNSPAYQLAIEKRNNLI
jgi:hypothetical protein